jgi:hypothetical protein
MSIPKSIYELAPLDISGRHARNGFLYQDHIAAKFCLDFILNNDLMEIWLESHDDITLIWKNDSAFIVEFVQVKNNNLTSRWSVSNICDRGKTNVMGSSILEKILAQDRCGEEVLFRIVSSYDVTDDLSILKQIRKSSDRINKQDKEKELSKEIKKKLGDIKSPNGKSIDDCISRFQWDKKADNVDTLIALNKLELENVLIKLNKEVFSDHRNEIYQRILAFCQDASSADISTKPDCFKIKKADFISWLNDTVDELYSNASGTKKLKFKLSNAKNIPADYISNAVELKYKYRQNRLSNDFIQSSDLQKLESVISGELYKLKILLDNNEISELDFHSICIKKLDEIALLPAFRDINIPQYLLMGYMYDLTNRCLHRYNVVQP